MTLDELRKHFPNASASVIALNTDNSDHKSRVEAQGKYIEQADGRSAKLECDPGHGTLRKTQVKARDTRRFLVRVTSVRKRLIDEDNLCVKYFVDVCRYAGCIPDDNPKQVKIEALQRQVAKEEEEHTVIEIWQIE